MKKTLFLLSIIFFLHPAYSMEPFEEEKQLLDFLAGTWEWNPYFGNDAKGSHYVGSALGNVFTGLPIKDFIEIDKKGYIILYLHADSENYRKTTYIITEFKEEPAFRTPAEPLFGYVVIAENRLTDARFLFTIVYDGLIVALLHFTFEDKRQMQLFGHMRRME